MFVNLLIVLSGKLPAGWVMGFSRLYCMLEGVDSLGKQGLLSNPVSTLNDKAKSICQLSWYSTHLLLTVKKAVNKPLFDWFGYILLFTPCLQKEQHKALIILKGSAVK